MEIEARDRFPLGAFRRWLISRRQVAAFTSSLYAHHVRGFLLACHEAEASYMDAPRLVAWDESRPLKARSAWRSAWRAFAAYSLEIGGPTLPTAFSLDRRLGPKPLREERRREALAPHPVMREIAAVIFGAVRPSSVPALRWGHVQAGMDNATVHNKETRVSFAIPMAAIRALMEWGKPERDASRPLIPKEPGSKEPMPEHKLRAIARQAKGLTGFDGRPLGSTPDKT